MLVILAAALGIASLVGCFYLVVAAVAVRRFAHRPTPIAASRPPVSILKPLHGEDRELFENLLSFCDQDYPALQLVCGVREASDPAIAVVRRVIAARPDCDIALIVDSRVAGTNYKIANLENMLPAAKHDLLVIADSDMRVGRGYLAAVTAPLAEAKAGLVTCLYRGLPRGGLAARLGAAWVNYGFLPSAIIGDLLRPGDGCFGATMALNRKMLAAIGGFASLRDHLADDYALGAAVRGFGERVVLSSHLVDTIVADPDLAALYRHELRWTRTIRSIAPVGYAASLITQPVTLALLGCLVSGFSWPSLALLAICLGCRHITVRAIERALALPRLSAWLVPVRDLLSFSIFVASFCGNNVAWRGGRFRIDAEGRLVADGDTRA